MTFLRTRLLWVLALALLAARVASACGVVSERETAAVRVTADAPSGVRIAFLGHASFLIESPAHVTAVTDYNGVNIPPSPPDIATMNHAHATHYTDQPDPRIAHVLRGWTDDGGPARIMLTVRDMMVRNIPTSIRNYMTGQDELYGNSIFIFETGGLCIAHLSHLHHTLTADDLATMGPIDVLMVPVDGIFTMNQQDMADVIAEVHPSVVLPMHYFGGAVLERFLALIRDRYEIRRNAASAITLSRESLPGRPTVIVLGRGTD
ncbi:MAG: MBL fold metallo-hydrolase [Acetobacteraceae bacterium]|nr:MBL fold metallo-hydrolase [Acetobacteraceae bacterium]